YQKHSDETYFVFNHGPSDIPTIGSMMSFVRSGSLYVPHHDQVGTIISSVIICVNPPRVNTDIVLLSFQ
ncbi:MAG: hypothetical protein ABIH42_02695, partial [Planctomycetota bacterium]